MAISYGDEYGLYGDSGHGFGFFEGEVDVFDEVFNRYDVSFSQSVRKRAPNSDHVWVFSFFFVEGDDGSYFKTSDIYCSNNVIVSHNLPEGIGV